MASQGPNSGSTFVDDATVGTVAWTNPGNAAANDAVYATASLSAATSHYLKATGFGFAIPTGATIKGIVVEWETQANSSIIDSSVKIVKGGSILGTEKSAGAAWPSSEAYNSYGSAVDLWGLTWTAADINDPTFGAVLSGVKSSGGGITGQIDHVRITVYYDPPAAAFFQPLLVMLQRFSPLGLPLLGRPVYSSQINVLPLADTLASFSDSIAVTVQRAAPSDTLATFSDSITVSIQRAQPADTLSTFSDSIKVTVQRAQPADTLASFSDSIAITVTRPISDTLASFADSIVAGLVKPRTITDTLSSFSDSITRTIQRQQPSDTLASFADSLAMKVIRQLADTLSTMSDVVGLMRPRAVADTLASFSDAIVVVAQRAPTGKFAALPPRLLVEINFPKDVARFSTREAVNSDNPHFHHELNESSGTVVQDSSGNGRTASYVAAPTLQQDSPISGQRGLGAILASFSSRYASTSQYVEQTGGPAAPGALTLSLLVKPSAFPTGGNKFDVFKNTGYGRISILSSGQVEIDLGTVFASGAANLLTLNQWTRIAVTVSGQGNNQTHTLYFDGVPVASAVGASQLAAMSATYRFGATGSTAATAFVGQLTSVAAFLAELDRLRHQQHVVGNPVAVTPPDLWSDVSQYVRAIMTKSGRAQRLDRIEAGTLTLELDNSDRRFEPGYQGTLTVLNYLANPSFETGILGWSATNGVVSQVSSTLWGGAYLPVGNWVGSFSASSAADVLAYGLNADGSRFSVVAGSQYDLGGQVYVKTAAAARTFAVGVEWFNAGGGSLGVSETPTQNLAQGSAGRFGVTTVTAPANAVSARVRVRAVALALNEVFYVDRVWLADTGATTDYLDGDIVGFYWEGTPHASRTLSSSVYYPFLLPMRRVRVRAIYPSANLARDSSFEREAFAPYTSQLQSDGAAWWASPALDGSTLVRENIAGFSGSWRAKFTAALSTSASLIMSGSSNRIPVVANQQFTVSAYMKRDAGNPTAALIRVTWYDKNGLNIGAGNPVAAAGLTNLTGAGQDVATSWTRYGGTFTAIAGAARAEIDIYPYWGGLGATPAPVYIDAVQVEYGASASTYSDSLFYSLFNGYVTAWPQSYPSQRRSTVAVTCIDGFAGLATALLTTKFAAELAGTRLGRILDQAGWPTAERTLDAGANSIMANDFTTAAGTQPTRVDALSHAQDVSDSELGTFFIDGSGSAVFHDANHRTTATRSITAQATFGDGPPSGSELPYLPGILPDYDVVRVFNEIRITRQSASSGDKPVEQVASDGVSQAHNWRRTMQRTTLLATDAACLTQAQALLARYKDPKLEMRTISLQPARDVRLWPVVLSTLISDRVTIVRRPQGLPPPLQNDYFIEAIEHQIQLGLGGTPGSWKTTYATSLAS